MAAITGSVNQRILYESPLAQLTFGVVSAFLHIQHDGQIDERCLAAATRGVLNGILPSVVNTKDRSVGPVYSAEQCPHIAPQQKFVDAERVVRRSSACGSFTQDTTDLVSMENSERQGLCAQNDELRNRFVAITTAQNELQSVLGEKENEIRKLKESIQRKNEFVDGVVKDTSMYTGIVSSVARDLRKSLFQLGVHNCGETDLQVLHSGVAVVLRTLRELLAESELDCSSSMQTINLSKLLGTVEPCH